MIAGPIPDAIRKCPACLYVIVECGNNNCDSRVELVALRSHGTTKEEICAEMPEWKLDGICCVNGHQIALPKDR